LIRQLLRQRIIPSALAVVLGEDAAEMTLGFPEKHPLSSLAFEVAPAPLAGWQAGNPLENQSSAWRYWRGVPLSYDDLLRCEGQLREFGAGWTAPIVIAGFASHGAQVFAPEEKLAWSAASGADAWVWRGLKQRLDPDGLFQPGYEPRQGGLPWNR